MLLPALRLAAVRAGNHSRVGRQLLVPLISGRLNSSDATTSSPQQLTQEEARGKAQALLEMLPGDNIFKKSAFATVSGGLTAFLVSQGIYVPNEETLILVAFLIMARLAYVKLASPIAGLFESYITDLRSKMTKAAGNELQQLEKEISMLEEFKDNAAVVEAFFETRRENIVLEAELSELQQTYTNLSSIKSRLNERVRRENERLAEEKRVRAEALMKGLLEELKKPKIQEAILKKCIADIGKVSMPQAAV